jgi:putative transposase
MVHYRRNRVAGGTYFFTTTLRDRRSTWLTDHIDAFWLALRQVKRALPFRVDAIVVLPDHWHAVITLPTGDADYSHRIRMVKARFGRSIRTAGVPIEINAKGEYLLWQRRFWEHTIRDENDLQRHIDYIHFNPVKHGLCSRAVEWPHSSIHRYMRLRWLDAAWGCESDEGEFGE